MCSCCISYFCCFFFFKQKTAYEMRISDWSSDVCSSDLTQRKLVAQARLQTARRAGGEPAFELREPETGKGLGLLPEPAEGDVFYDIEEIGRASCRERVCQYV